MSDNTLTEVTDTSDSNQAQVARTYSQEEVDGMMARMKSSLQKRLLKPYEDLGDPEELRNIKTEWEKRQQEQQVKRGEFEKILQDKAAKWEQEISKRDQIIKDYRVNTPLLSAAARYNAVNAEQVKSLLISNVRLNESGDVEVIDSKGSVRYTDRGEPLGVDDLVREFLDSNPHFRTATPATTATRTSIAAPSPQRIDVSKLDMNNPDHKRLYREHRKALGLR